MSDEGDPADDAKFQGWLRQGSELIELETGLDLNDLPDFPSRAYFDSELSPNEAIEAAIEDGYWEDLEELFNQ